MTNAGRPRPGLRADEPVSQVGAGTGTTTGPRHGSALPGTASQHPASATSGARRRVSRTPRWRRSLRGPRGKWLLAGTAGVLIVLVGLLVSGFLSSPATPVGDEPSGDAGAGAEVLQSLAPSASASGSSARTSGSATGPANAGDIKQQLQREINNPLNNLRGAGAHTVTITARSSRPMPLVGYLVPTGSDAYGARKKIQTFAITQRAFGKGHLAAVFIQADATGVPITCSITIDGKAASTATTSGAYGRQICLG